MEPVREIIFYQNHFQDFFDKQTEKVKNKIDEVLFLITIIERVPRKFFQHMEGTDGLYEVRVEVGSNIFRIFCCFDEGRLVVLFNGFQKKTQKTPKSEIEKAIKLKVDYFAQK
ncbi:type II toxin-antitoxin system RelE/ParE family toxin [Rufibacter sp. LB8]|uniref:type II toxin-antitoxin system RelE/ParE family toxin n=1 Tax=Rufibacter sp. LB8 TaxID=2777781 RepID=UPI00178C3D16